MSPYVTEEGVWGVGGRVCTHYRHREPSYSRNRQNTGGCRAVNADRKEYVSTFLWDLMRSLWYLSREVILFKNLHSGVGEGPPTTSSEGTCHPWNTSPLSTWSEGYRDYLWSCTHLRGGTITHIVRAPVRTLPTAESSHLSPEQEDQ